MLFRREVILVLALAELGLVCVLPVVAYADFPCSFFWNRDLKSGSTGIDVTMLQRFLNADPYTALASSGPGSPGLETEKFGAMTRRSVIAFQNQHADQILIPNGLSRGTGIVGFATRQALNNLCISKNSSTTSDLVGKLSVSVRDESTKSATQAQDALVVSDPGQEDEGIAPAGAGVPFLRMQLDAGDKDVVVTKVVVERVGPGQDAAFVNFGLYDPQGIQVGRVVSLDANHQIIITQHFTVPAHASSTYELYANTQSDLSNFDGQMPRFRVVSIEASSPVVGPLPLYGSLQKLNNTLVVGGATAYTSQFDPGVAQNRYIGETGVKFSGIRLVANSQEDVSLAYIIWRQSGSVSPRDIENIETVANGVSYGTFISPYSDREYVSIFDPALVIRKGESLDVYVRGNLLATGANRTVQFDIDDNTDDIGLGGNSFNFGVGVTPGGNTAMSGNSVFLTDTGDTDGNSLSPFYSGSPVTVRGGTVISIDR